ARHISSSRQLPLTLYQIQTKFRNEERPRFGVLRTSEFLMKDAYSFDTSPEQLNESYQRMYDAYCRIFARCGLEYLPVEAESGPIGGDASHEFMIPAANGEDRILRCKDCGYAANQEKCKRRLPEYSFEGEPTGELQDVKTPDCKSIDELCRRWKEFTGGKLKPRHTLKTLVYRVECELTPAEKEKVNAAQEELGSTGWKDFYFNWIVVLRGDHELNEAKFRSALLDIHRHELKFEGKSVGLALMDEEEARKAGFVIGFVGPDAAKGLTRNEFARTRVMIDPAALQSQFWVTGANKVDTHCMHFNWERDFVTQETRHTTNVRDIGNAHDGDGCPKCDGTLELVRGIEAGHVFKLGTKYSVALGAEFLDEKEQRHPIIMGCYGIGINRIVAAAAETLHDDNGLIWPLALAPYSVLVIPLNMDDDQVQETAERYYRELSEAGVDVLFDDRPARPGFKFKDADLVGIPLRIVIGGRGLKEGIVEVKWRREEEPAKIAIERGVQYVLDQLEQRRREDAARVPSRG
ncbi:MAG: proline--tRNA ligase, partial [Planctomycetes bacterium]|nr:proline--tRNA ligase [Planctomycetota bacterium]